jgi:hypothetical protein
MNAEQLQLSDPVLITIDFQVDRLWTDRELLVHLLAHFSGLLREIPAMLADNDAAAAAQRPSGYHGHNFATGRGMAT